MVYDTLPEPPRYILLENYGHHALMFDRAAFSLHVKRKMDELDLSHRRMAAEIGVSKSVIQRILRGDKVSVESYVRFVEFLSR